MTASIPSSRCICSCESLFKKFPGLRVLWFGNAHPTTFYEDLSHSKTEQNVDCTQQEFCRGNSDRNATDRERDLQHLHQVGLAKIEKHMNIMKIPKAPFSNLSWLTNYDSFFLQDTGSRNGLRPIFLSVSGLVFKLWSPWCKSRANLSSTIPKKSTRMYKTYINSAEKTTSVGKCDQICSCAQIFLPWYGNRASKSWSAWKSWSQREVAEILQELSVQDMSRQRWGLQRMLTPHFLTPVSCIWLSHDQYTYVADAIIKVDK